MWAEVFVLNKTPSVTAPTPNTRYVSDGTGLKRGYVYLHYTPIPYAKCVASCIVDRSH